MNPHRRGAVAFATLLLALCLTLPAAAQQVKPADGNDSAFKRMEIWNGPSRTVHYFSRDLSPGEQAALRDLERAENNLAVADQVMALRGLYLRNERLLEERRGQVNPLLYGYSSEYTAGLLPVGFGGGYGSYATYPYGFGFGGFGSYYGGNPYAVTGAAVGSVSNSLAFGVGNEGVLKNELTRGLAEATAGDAPARAARAYDAARVAAASSERLRAGLGWGKGNVVAAGHERLIGGPVSVTTKDGKTLDGTLVADDPEWITVETAKEEVTLRKSDVTRIVRPKKETKP
jgi:hypothetical protein